MIYHHVPEKRPISLCFKRKAFPCVQTGSHRVYPGRELALTKSIRANKLDHLATCWLTGFESLTWRWEAGLSKQATSWESGSLKPHKHTQRSLKSAHILTGREKSEMLKSSWYMLHVVVKYLWYSYIIYKRHILKLDLKEIM